MSTTDHLANERTFLAWFRTGLSLLGFGILIAKLRFLEAGAGMAASAGVRSTRLGIAFACGGLLTLLLSASQYWRTNRMINEGKYESPVRVVLAFASVAFALGLVSVIYLLSISK